MSQNITLNAKNNNDQRGMASSGHVFSLEWLCQAGDWARNNSFSNSQTNLL